MPESLIVFHSNALRAGTFILSQGFQVEHRAIKRLLAKYKSEFEQFGVITMALPKPSKIEGGRPVEELLLNEEQAMYLGSLLTNNVVVRQFKIKLVKEFSRLRNESLLRAVDKHNAEYYEKRTQGKVTRKGETDVIKDFVDYATAQGITSAKFYYSNITKMENKALFVIEQKYPNIRDLLDIHQLSTISVADQIVSKWLREGMDKNMNYKDIYLLCKEKIEVFSETIGKSPIQEVIQGSRTKKIC